MLSFFRFNKVRTYILREEGDNMHVLHISTPKSWRGGEQQLAYLIGELEEKGIRQTVLCREGSKMETFCLDHKINVISQKKRTSFDPFFAFKIKQICKSMKVDLIHTHDSHAHSFSILSSVLFRNSTPIIVSRRVDFPVKDSWFSKFKYNHDSVKKILCVSNKIKEITSEAIKNKSVLRTIYSCIDSSRFHGKNKSVIHHELNLSKEIKLVGNVAALAPHKDYFTFLKTADLVLDKRNDIHFVAIGDGPQKEEIFAAHQKCKHKDRIHFLGFRSDVPDLLPELDIFFIPSETEGLGTSILDAFANSCPVVATAAGGIPEIVIDGNTGLLGEIKNPENLSKLILQLIDDESLKSILKSGQQQLLKRFDKKALGENTLKQYEEVMDELE